ncbi:MAG: Mth938-like domain-containing protein [Brevirhabdus sp.]
MRLNDVDFGGRPPVEGYGPGFFRIAGKVHEGPLLILPSGVCPWGGLEETSPLIAAASDIDVLFLGMGPEIAHPPAALRQAVEEAGTGLEVMASPTAARTYNVLLSEGRRIGAALLPI